MDKNVVQKNIYIGVLYQALTLITGFILRKYIVSCLGVYNLGVIGVFENIMSMLSLLNFGIGSACMYYLYKYFAANNNQKVSEIYVFFKKSYQKVALGILAVGVFIIINIQMVIDIEGNRLFLQTIFGAFLFKTVIYNLLICPRTFLQCDGKRYIGIAGDLISMLLFLFLKIYYLEKTGSLLVYIILLICEMSFSTAYVYYNFRKKYPHLDTKNAKISQETKNSIFKYSRSLAVSNINFFVYSSTDNIVLSKFCGTIAVGYLSNYYMIVNAIKGFVTQITGAIEAQIIKSYNVETVDKKAQYDFSMFFCFILGSFCVTCLNVLTNDFIGMFFGKDFVMNNSIIYLMSAILFINLMKKPSSMVVISKKLVHREVPFTLSMMTVNIVFSILLAIFVGPSGVLMATILAEFVLFAGDELIALKSDLKLGTEIIIKKLIYSLIVVLETMLANKLAFVADNYFAWLTNALICTAIVAVVILLFFNTKEFKMLFAFIFKRDKSL